MKSIIKNVNKKGLEEIAEFLGQNYKKAVNSGEGASYFSESMLQARADEAEFQLSEGNPACIELKAHDSIHGFTQEFKISEAGLDSSEIEIDE